MTAPPRVPSAAALVLLLAWLALLALARPGGAFWGVDALRSLGGPGVALAIAAAVFLGLAVRRPSRPAVWAMLGVVAAVLVAFPLREGIHWLGDTSLRLHALHNSARTVATLDDWRRILHAEPLDLVVNFMLPAWLVGRGLAETTAASVVSAALGVALLAGAWRLAGALCEDARWRPAVTALLVLSGVLEVFAGYAESSGLFLVGLVWWLAAMLRPLDRPGRAIAVVFGWLALLLVHRMALLVLPALLLRGVAPDAAPARRALLGLAAGAGAIGVALALSGAGRLRGDAIELSAWLTDPARARLMSAPDLLNLLALVAPLLFFLPAIATREGLRRFARSGHLLWLGAAAAPLLGLVLVQPPAPSGLGAQRDWDLGVPLGLVLTTAVVWLLRALPATRRTALALLLVPALALPAVAWLALNADVERSVGRAVTLAYGETLPPSQRSHLFMFLGERAAEVGNDRLAAGFYDRAYALVRNPRRALAAADAWIQAGDDARGRELIRMARATGLPPTLAQAADRLDSVLAARADTARAAPDSGIVRPALPGRSGAAR